MKKNLKLIFKNQHLKTRTSFKSQRTFKNGKLKKSVLVGGKRFKLGNAKQRKRARAAFAIEKENQKGHLVIRNKHFGKAEVLISQEEYLIARAEYIDELEDRYHKYKNSDKEYEDEALDFFARVKEYAENPQKYFKSKAFNEDLNFEILRRKRNNFGKWSGRVKF